MTTASSSVSESSEAVDKSLGVFELAMARGLPDFFHKRKEAESSFSWGVLRFIPRLDCGRRHHAERGKKSRGKRWKPTGRFAII